MLLRKAAGRLIDATVKRRRPGSNLVYELAGRIVQAYENRDVEMPTNGEHWLQEKLESLSASVAFDIGANRGDWAAGLLARTTVCKVFCFEPVPATFAELERNIADQRAILIHAACSSANGTLKMHWAVDNPFISTAEDISKYGADIKVEDIDVEAVTGDSQVQKFSIEKIDMLKVDAEGHDLSVLKGFSKTLADGRVDLIQFEYNQFTRIAGNSLSDFFDLLGDGFLVGRLLPAGIELFGYDPFLDNFAQANFIAIKKSLVTERNVKNFAMRPAVGPGGAALKRSLQSDLALARRLGL